MKFGWLLICLQVSLSEEGSNKNEKSQAGVKLRNQRTGSSNTDLGAAAQESILTEVTPKTTGQSKGDANVKQPSKSKKEGKVKVSRGDEKVSAIGIFLKLITRGLLKKIALPAIVRLGLFNLFNCQVGSFQSATGLFPKICGGYILNAIEYCWGILSFNWQKFSSGF